MRQTEFRECCQLAQRKRLVEILANMQADSSYLPGTQSTPRNLVLWSDALQIHFYVDQMAGSRDEQLGRSFVDAWAEVLHKAKKLGRELSAIG
jgi:hypothetical protein